MRLLDFGAPNHKERAKVRSKHNNILPQHTLPQHTLPTSNNQQQQHQCGAVT